jgi:hypothetical protein
MYGQHSQAGVRTDHKLRIRSAAATKVTSAVPTGIQSGSPFEEPCGARWQRQYSPLRRP